MSALQVGSAGDPLCMTNLPDLQPVYDALHKLPPTQRSVQVKSGLCMFTNLNHHSVDITVLQRARWELPGS